MRIALESTYEIVSLESFKSLVAMEKYETNVLPWQLLICLWLYSL